MIMTLLKYHPLPLMELAARRLTVNLFKEPTILTSISNSCDKFPPHETNQFVWHDILEVKLPNMISKLKLPDSLSNLLKDAIEPMGTQIIHWKMLHEEYSRDSHGEEFYFDASVLEKLYWTSSGAVDYQKTAEELIHSDVIDIVNKYKLACLYCMDEYVPIFWRELPEERKRYFCSKEGRCLESGGMGQEFWWPYIIKGEESELETMTRSYRRVEESFHKYAFQCSVKKGNKAAAEFFFQKLTPEEKEASLDNAAQIIIERYSNENYQDIVFSNEKHSELLIFLLALMTPEKEKQIFQEQPIDVLIWFLAWPLRDMLLENAESIWSLFSPVDSEKFLCILYENFNSVDTHLVKVYHEFFLRIPSDSSKGFVDRQCNAGSYFHEILRNENIKALEIFFRCLDVASRKTLVFSDLALDILKVFISEGHFDVLEVCFREASLSQNERKELKEIWEINDVKSKTRKYARLFNPQDETNKR